LSNLSFIKSSVISLSWRLQKELANCSCVIADVDEIVTFQSKTQRANESFQIEVVDDGMMMRSNEMQL
jgi:tryptophanyl-tRNA synthetase